MAHLQMSKAKATQHGELQELCFTKKTDFLTSLSNLSLQVEENLKSYALIDPMSQNPWEDLLAQITALHCETQAGCATPKGLIALFTSDAQSHLELSVNTLIDTFNALDALHQTKKLHAYTSQWGLLHAWRNLNAQGIHTLADLLAARGELSPEYLYRMGD